MESIDGRRWITAFGFDLPPALYAYFSGPELSDVIQILLYLRFRSEIDRVSHMPREQAQKASFTNPWVVPNGFHNCDHDPSDTASGWTLRMIGIRRRDCAS